jgi:hypothetical protein
MCLQRQQVDETGLEQQETCANIDGRVAEYPAGSLLPERMKNAT